MSYKQERMKYCLPIYFNYYKFTSRSHENSRQRAAIVVGALQGQMCEQSDEEGERGGPGKLQCGVGGW